MAEHAAEPLICCVPIQLITSELPRYLHITLPSIVTLPLFATDPTEFRVAPRTCHMLAGSIFGNGSLALDAFCDEQESHPLFILPL